MSSQFTHDTELLTYVQVARMLNVHPDTVRRYWKQGKLKMVRLPGTEKKLGLVRFRVEDVEGLMKQNEDANP